MASCSRGAGLVALAALAGFVAPAAVGAVTFTVDNPADIIDANLADGVCAAVGGGCTLRAAVMQANLAGGVGATILLPAGTYLLFIPVLGEDGDWEGDLNLTTPASGNPVIHLVGAGAGTTIIDPQGLSRAFTVAVGRSAAIEGVTIRNGYVFNTAGGGILNAGTLTVSNSVITGNEAAKGGGIASVGALTVTSTVISLNRAPLEGGGIYGYETSLTLTDCWLSANTAMGGYAGGLSMTIGSVVVDRTTISGNSTSGWAGGILLYNSSLVMRSSTISGNHAHDDGGGLDISGPGSVANIYSTSILFNEADADGNGGLGGGIHIDGSTVNLRNTVVAGNYRAGGPDYDDCFGTIGSYGTTLFTSAASVCTIVVGVGSTGYVNSLDTLGPLQANGGPTPTHALLAGSNAIDGTLAAFPCIDQASQPLLTDQRGVTRTLGLRCDVGAFEFNTLFSDGFESGDTSLWL